MFYRRHCFVFFHCHFKCILSFSNSGAVLHSMAATGAGPSFVDIESDGSRVEDGLLSSECDTPMYEKPQFGHYFRQDSEDKHVQFDIGKLMPISSILRILLMLWHVVRHNTNVIINRLYHVDVM